MKTYIIGKVRSYPKLIIFPPLPWWSDAWFFNLIVASFLWMLSILSQLASLRWSFTTLHAYFFYANIQFMQFLYTYRIHMPFTSLTGVLQQDVVLLNIMNLVRACLTWARVRIWVRRDQIDTGWPTYTSWNEVEGKCLGLQVSLRHFVIFQFLSKLSEKAPF